MTIKLSLKEELIEDFRKIREGKLLAWGILIGIIASLIAGVINDLIGESTLYPWIYLFILIVILLILTLKFLTPYLNWKRFLYKFGKMKKANEKLNEMIKAHRKKYPVKK